MSEVPDSLEKILSHEEYSWLKESDFYNSLDHSSNLEDLNLIYCSKYTEDIDLFLDVTNFWGMNSYPHEFFDLIFKEKPVVKLTELYEITKSTFYKSLLSILSKEVIDGSSVNIAARDGNIHFLKYLYYEHHDLIKNNIYSIVVVGNLKCIKYIYENFIEKYSGAKFSEKTGDSSSHNTKPYIFSEFWNVHSFYGSISDLESLKFLHKTFLDNFGTEKRCPWNELTTSYAAGYLDSLKYAIDDGCHISYLVSRINKPDVLEFLHQRGYPLPEMTPECIDDNLECIKYLVKNGINWSIITSNSAALNGDLEILEYVCENGCPFSSETFENAISSGNIKCLEYLHQKCIRDGVVPLWNKQVINDAGIKGNLEALKFLHKNGCPYDKNNIMFMNAAKKHCKIYIMNEM